MKKLIALFLTLCIFAAGMVACTPPQAGTIRFAGMKGPTSLGLVKLMEDHVNGSEGAKYQAEILTKADEITPKLINGQLDMAALPANVAATVYQRTNGAIVTVAVNTLGVVYIVEKGESITSLSDLVGKKIYAVGRGTTPEYGLSYILSQNGLSIDQLNIEWKNEATEILPLLKTEENAIAMIPQPFVTAATTQVEGLRVAISLNDEWNKLDNGSQFITGVLVARREFVEKNPQALATFLTEYEASIQYAKDNVPVTAELVVKYGIMDKVPLAKMALPNCNLTYMAGQEMKTALSAYLATLHAQNPAAVGGSLPGDDFYYVAG